MLLILVSLAGVSAAFAGGILTERSSEGSATAIDEPGSEAVALRPSRAAEGEVFVYGDSLVVQAEPYLDGVARSLGMRVTARAFGGIAPCDAAQWLADDLQQEHPSIVVLAFSGNSLTDCMRDQGGELLSGDSLVAKYRADIEEAVALATQADVPVVVASPPAAENRAGSWQRLDAMYRDIATAGAPRVQYADAGTEIAPAGIFSANQRCLPFEVRPSNDGCANDDTGVSVRAPDGVHFCAGVVDSLSKAMTCPGYSSGALRYAIALMSAARLDLDYLAAKAVAGVSP